MQRRTSIDSSQNTADGAWAAAVRMLGRRELSAAQVRDRLARRGWTEAAIEPAIARLSSSGALDDARVARACARTRAGLKQQGRDRVLREILALGVARDVARTAVDEVFGPLDEGDLVKAALEKRLRVYRGSR